jgi:outer membrane receptor for ferric coprogen and ferric-rhodotorulic acid
VALTGIFCSEISLAQNTMAQINGDSISLPAQSLSSALRELARQTGSQVIFSPQAVAGKSAPAISGNLNARQAAELLLQGTGLVVAQEDDVLIVRPASAPQSIAPGEEAVLPTITVTAGRDTLSEGTGAYTTGAATTTARLPLTLRETPQTITVVTRQQMDDFGLNTVDEILRNTSGVYAQRLLLGSGYSSRGFGLSTQYDGMASTTGLGVTDFAAPDSTFLDHMEIQQGAAGLLTGAGQPGGTLNMVRKRPTETFQANAEAAYGSWDRKRLVGDISGPLTQSGALRGRFVAVSDTGDSFVDYVHSDKQAFYGALEMDLGRSTTLSFNVQYQKNDYNEPAGVPAAQDGGHLDFIDRSTFIGLPHGGIDSEDMRASLSLEQKLPGDWNFKATYSYAQNAYDALLGFGYFHSGTFRQTYYDREREMNAVDAFASGPVQLFGRRHEFALGVNGYKSEYRGIMIRGAEVPFDFYAMDYGTLPVFDVPAHDLGPAEETRQHGAWGVARLNIADPLKLIIGTRLSWYEFRNSSGVKTMDESAVLSPYAGIIYDLDQQYSVYASYSDIFNPQTIRDRTGKVLEPIVGSNYEAGIKGEFFNARLNAAAAVFRLEQTNRALQDTEFGNPNGVCQGWCYIASGKVVSEGVDLSLTGALSPNWNVAAAYTYSRSEFATGTQKGDPLDTRIPKHAFRLASSYHIPGSAWTIGGSLRAQSRVYTGNIEQETYALVNLMAKYQINEQAEVIANIDNLFDREYWYPNVSNFNQYGEPRRFAIKLKYQF